MKNKNLPFGLKYGEAYSSKEVNEYGNNDLSLNESKRFMLGSIDIHILDNIIDYRDRYWGLAFKDHTSKELKSGVGKALYLDREEIVRRMDDYENGRPVPPIVVRGANVRDGNHRLYAQYKLGYKEIDAFIELEHLNFALSNCFIFSPP